MSHVRDVYFLMITLALGMVLWGVSYRWIPVTGGDNGISGIPRLEAHAGLPFAGPVAFYYVTLLVFVVCAFLLALLVSSPFGFTLRGIRENESRMKSLGFNTWLHCYLSYVISGAFASVAGVVWAYYNGFVSPTYLDLTASSELFLMVTLGGPGTLIGPALGAWSDRPAEECDQRVHAAMAAHPRHRLHRDHPGRSAGTVELVEVAATTANRRLSEGTKSTKTHEGVHPIPIAPTGREPHGLLHERAGVFSSDVFLCRRSSCVFVLWLVWRRATGVGRRAQFRRTGGGLA